MALAAIRGDAIEGVVGAAVGIGAMVWAIRRDSGGSSGPPQVEETETPEGTA